MKRMLIPAALLLLVGCDRHEGTLLNGRVEAYLTDLAPRVSGRLVELKVQEGQRVKAGDLLARVAAEELGAAVDRDAAGAASAEAKSLELKHGTREEDVAQGEARVRDAEAALKLGEENLRRVQKLFRDGVIAQAELDRAIAERDRAGAALNLQQKALLELRAGARSEQRQGALAEAARAKATLTQSQTLHGFTEIRAPFDGVVVHRLRELGSVLPAGQPVLTLARVDQLWIRVYLPQPVQATAKLGQSVTVTTVDKRSFDAALDEVSSEAEYTPKMVETREERVNLVYPARIHLARGWDKGLLPGVAVDVRLKDAK